MGRVSGTVTGFTIALLTASAEAHAALPWLDYQAVTACPNRERLESELRSRLPAEREIPRQRLRIEVTFDGQTYEGNIRFYGGDNDAPRLVRHESCEQVIHALALIGALMVETEEQAQNLPLAPQETPRPTSAPSSPAAPPTVVTAPLQAKPKDARIEKNGENFPRISFGTGFSATTERVITTDWWFGARLGLEATLHGLSPSFQDTLRLSVVRVKSQSLGTSPRSASITWTSVRTDVCHGIHPHPRSTLGACALFDLGRLDGQGQVDQSDVTKHAYWARVGLGVYLRQTLVGALSLDADLGLLVPFTHPEFYFAETRQLPEQSLNHVRTVGPTANLGLGLTFY
jgi:hypothetical protein